MSHPVAIVSGMRVVIYGRLSSGRASELNLHDQLARCREYAAARGWLVVDEISDFGESAYERDSIEDRPGFAQVLAMVNGRDVDAVLAWRPDRLWRDPIEAAVFMRRCVRAGVTTVATVVEGERDPSNPGDEMVSTIVAAVGRYESAAKAARLRAKARQRAELGRSNGGHRPFGYTRDGLALEPREADALRQVADVVISTGSLRAGVRRLDELGVPTAMGSAWRTATLRNALLRPRSAGLREYRGTVLGKAEWPAILTIEQHTALHDILEDPSRRATPGGGRTYLLTGGIAVCGLCGVPLTAQGKLRGGRSYVCISGIRNSTLERGCGKIRRAADPLEAEVVARLFVAVEDAALAASEPASPAAPAVDLDELAAAEMALTELARDHYVLKVIERDEYFAARGPLAVRANAMRARVLAATASSTRPALDRLRVRWEHIDLAERRTIVAQFIERVVVKPAVAGRNAFDPTRIEVRWR